jgi:hypothetical protein
VVEREFCSSLEVLRNLCVLFRHVAKTGDIKDFVITEEIGIAKGIRRIVAVTGQKAQDIGQLAQLLQEKLDVLERSDRKIKDSGLKSFSLVRADSPSIGSDSQFFIVRNLAKPISPPSRRITSKNSWKLSVRLTINKTKSGRSN